MSNYWDLFCETCSEGAGVHWNHGDEELARFLNAGGVQAAADVAKVRALAFGGLEISVRFDSGPEVSPDLGDFCLTHKDHKIVVMSEYGYTNKQCAERFTCPNCATLHFCRLEKRHAGDHDREAAK